MPLALRILLAIEDGDHYLLKPITRVVARFLCWRCPSCYLAPWSTKLVRCCRVRGHRKGQHLNEHTFTGWDSNCAGEVK